MGSVSEVDADPEDHVSDEAERAALRRIVASGRAHEVALALLGVDSPEALVSASQGADRLRVTYSATTSEDGRQFWAVRMVETRTAPNVFEENAVIEARATVRAESATLERVRQVIRDMRLRDRSRIEVLDALDAIPLYP